MHDFTFPGNFYASTETIKPDFHSGIDVQNTYAQANVDLQWKWGENGSTTQNVTFAPSALSSSYFATVLSNNDQDATLQEPSLLNEHAVNNLSWNLSSGDPNPDRRGVLNAAGYRRG